MIMEKVLAKYLYSMQYYDKSMFLSAVLVFISTPVLILYSGSGSSYLILAIHVFILSTVFFFKLKWRKHIFDASPVPGRMEEEQSQPIVENVSQNESNQQKELVKKDEQKAASPPDLPFSREYESNSDSIRDENFKLCLTCPELDSVDRDTESSKDENYEDDEESLIEIALPNNLPCSLTQEPNRNTKQDFPDFLPDSIFNQQGLMELLADINEMNEEESLIEIDISIGSTICSRVKLEA